MFPCPKPFVLRAAWLGVAISCGGELLAHGGQYRGPADVVPPAPSGSGSPTPSGPHGPKTPNGPPNPAQPTAPATPHTGPSTANTPGVPGRTGPSTPRGGPVPEDLTSWDLWWEFNKDPYIGLKAAIDTQSVVTGDAGFYLGPTRRMRGVDRMLPSYEQKRDLILPALKKALDATEDRDIVSACMVAMAKAGMDHATFELRDVFAPRLRSGNQEVSETAALALGIAAQPDARSLDLLAALALDAPAGRDACGRSEVNERTRAFACYGLGLVAHAQGDLAVDRGAFTALRAIVDDVRVGSRNLKVAAINAIGLIGVRSDDEGGRALVAEAARCLHGYYTQDLGPGAQLIQAHVPTAIAKLLGNDAADARLVAEYKDLFAADLAGVSKRSSNDVARSCALALGRLCRPCDDADAADARYCQLLLDTWHGHKDAQARAFALLALGQIGGRLNRSTLLVEFDKANKSMEKPWVAMAMGVFAFEQYEAARLSKSTVEIEAEFGRALHAALAEARDPKAVAALAVALGLCEYEPAADDMRALLLAQQQKEDLAGYLCIGLALMNDRRSTEDIHGLVLRSVRKPELLRQAAVALGRLGDKSVTDDLQAMLVAEDQNLARLSAVASALGFIGDKRTIAPLVGMLQDRSITGLSRAFAAVALGGIADKEPLPWNSKIGCDINYRAAVETLTDGQAGILDIL